MTSPIQLPRNVTKLFLRACKKGDLKRVQSLLPEVLDVNCRDDDQSTGLQLVCGASGDSTDIVNQFICAGADVSLCDKNGVNCVMRAVSASNVAVLSLLLGLPDCPDVNAVSNGGFTAQALCVTNCQEQRLEIMRILLSHGSDLNFETNTKDTLWSFLVWNSFILRAEEIAFLSQFECKTVCNVNAQGRTAQISQCCNGVYGQSRDSIAVFCQMVDFFLSHGQLINDFDDQQCTCLAMCTLGGSVPCVEFLVKRGASLVLSSFGLNTPLHLSVGTGDLKMFSFLILEQLAQNKLEEALVAVNNDGYTPFLVFCDGGNDNCDLAFFDLFMLHNESVLNHLCEDTCSQVLALQGAKAHIVLHCLEHLEKTGNVHKYLALLERTREYIIEQQDRNDEISNTSSTYDNDDGQTEEGALLINNDSLLHGKLSYATENTVTDGVVLTGLLNKITMLQGV